MRRHSYVLYSFLLLVLYLFRTPGFSSLNLALSLSAVAISYFLLLDFLRDIGKRYLVFEVVVWTTLLELLFLISYTATSDHFLVFNEQYRINYLVHESAIVIAFLVPIFAILCLSPFIAKRTRGNALEKNSNPTEIHFDISIIVAGVCFLGVFSDALFEIPFISYFSRFAHGAFVLYAFWFGYWNKKLGFLWPVIIGIYCTYALFIILSGGRFTAIITLALFSVGFVYSLSKGARVWGGIILLISLPFVLYLSGLLALVRNDIGRGDFEIINDKRVATFNEVFSTKMAKSGINSFEVIQHSMGRNVKWPNLAVISLAPQRVDYRGFYELEKELFSLLQIGGLSYGFTSDEVRDYREEMIKNGLGNSPANKYGYSVTRLNSVEWSVLADGWSRGGPAGYFIYISIALGLLLMVERRVLDRVPNPAYYTLYASVLVQLIWFRMGSQPLYLFLRFLILHIGLCAVVIYLLRNFPIWRRIGLMRK